MTRPRPSRGLDRLLVMPRPVRVALTFVVVGVLALTCWGIAQLVGLTRGLVTSSILGDAGASRDDVNLLVMGLDSRVDENGDPLPQNIYDALHAGDQSDGGLNANVLMLVHLPADGSKATALSIPRDDYVDLPGCPDGQCKGKIKQAYGLGHAAASTAVAKDLTLSKKQREQKARDAGRLAEVTAVQAFLGVHVDHFVEVTMVAFYQLAEAVQPVTVCVKEPTQDSYSGADFAAGQQQVNAVQAVAFVRQRRDLHNRYNFTDLDRERRQQAFIISLATQLKGAGTLANPVKLGQILDVAKQNTAIDSGLDVMSFAQQAQRMAAGNLSFYTLPITGFGKAPTGEDINLVDPVTIRALTANLLSSQGASSTTTSPTAHPKGTTSTPPPATSHASTQNSRSTPARSAQPEGSPVRPVDGSGAPAPTDLSALSAGGIPCVK